MGLVCHLEGLYSACIVLQEVLDALAFPYENPSFLCKRGHDSPALLRWQKQFSLTDFEMDVMNQTLNALKNVSYPLSFLRDNFQNSLYHLLERLHVCHLADGSQLSHHPIEKCHTVWLGYQISKFNKNNDNNNSDPYYLIEPKYIMENIFGNNPQQNFQKIEVQKKCSHRTKEDTENTLKEENIKYYLVIIRKFAIMLQLK